jgi:U4/U6 small nuclear ribonucleoprotein PRP31
MATLADELLNDFEDSGSEGGDQEAETLFQNRDETMIKDGLSKATRQNDGMELDDDEEEVGDEDEEAVLAARLNGDSARAPEDEEETKAKVEKMEMRGVNDVRNVAGLMKTLEPVLKVCATSGPLLTTSSRFTTVNVIVLTVVPRPLES